jgi:hypothetical protein
MRGPRSASSSSPLPDRFGTVAQPVGARVRDGGPAELKRWLLRVVIVSTIDDVLDG